MTKKITVSLPDELVERVQHLANAGVAASVSAYTAQALSEKLDRNVRARRRLTEELSRARERDPQAYATAREHVDAMWARLEEHGQ